MSFRTVWLIFMTDSRRSYCGGTYKGLAGKLDYIKGMGFDVVSLRTSPPTTFLVETELNPF